MDDEGRRVESEKPFRDYAWDVPPELARSACRRAIQMAIVLVWRVFMGLPSSQNGIREAKGIVWYKRIALALYELALAFLTALVA